MDTNVMMNFEFDIGWNVEKDGYECYDGLWTWIKFPSDPGHMFYSDLATIIAVIPLSNI